MASERPGQLLASAELALSAGRAEDHELGRRVEVLVAAEVRLPALVAPAEWGGHRCDGRPNALSAE